MNAKGCSDGVAVLETLYRDTDPHMPSLEELENGMEPYAEQVKQAEMLLTKNRLMWWW